MRRPSRAAMLLALFVGCSPTAPTAPPASVGVTANPTGVPSTDAPPSGPLPAATYDPETLLLIRTGAAAVIVDSLPIRETPSLTAGSPGDFVRGDVVVLMLFEPVEVDGTLWYYVIQVTTPDPGILPDLPTPLAEEEFALEGWIAARDETGETVAKLASRCPDETDHANVSAMLPGERLACFGSTPITLDGVFVCVDCSGDELTYEPEWLAGQSGGTLRDVSDSNLGTVALHFPPSVEAPEESSPIRVTGHFDDPRATTCVITVSSKTVEHEVAVQLCRLQFVVDSFEPLSSEFIPPPD